MIRVMALDSRAIVQLGLVLLIATPVVRVAFMLIAFVVQRDRSLCRHHRPGLGIVSSTAYYWAEHETPSRGRP